MKHFIFNNAFPEILLFMRLCVGMVEQESPQITI